MSMESRLSPGEHARLPWRIHEIAPDFDLIDAWALPAHGALEEFADLEQILTGLDPSADEGSSPAQKLFAVRRWIGGRLGWDDAPNTLPIPGCEETSIRDRLPPDLEAETAGDTLGQTGFRPVYSTEDESARELSNSLVHAILHLGWVARTDGGYRGQLGVYVKHRGRIGGPYMAIIAPFRHRIVYPALLRRIGSAWDARPHSTATSHAAAPREEP